MPPVPRDLVLLNGDVAVVVPETGCPGLPGPGAAPGDGQLRGAQDA